MHGSARALPGRHPGHGARSDRSDGAGRHGCHQRADRDWPAASRQAGARALVALGGLCEYATRERYQAGELVRMVFAGAETAIPRDEYAGERGSRFTGHKGFNWRRLQRTIERRFDVERRLFSPLPLLGAGSTARCGSYAGSGRHPERDAAGAALRGQMIPTPPRADGRNCSRPPTSTACFRCSPMLRPPRAGIPTSWWQCGHR